MTYLLINVNNRWLKGKGVGIEILIFNSGNILEWGKGIWIYGYEKIRDFVKSEY